MAHKHKWYVFSTAIDDGVLMLYCKCGAYGIVRDHTKKEWNEAFYAPSHNYRWNGGDHRVEIVPGYTTYFDWSRGTRTIKRLFV